MIRKNPKLVDRIPTVIANKTHGNVRFAKDYMQSLKLVDNEYAIGEALENLPDKLYDHYMLELERLKTKRTRRHGYVGVKILSLVALANRQLRFAELQHALVMIREPECTKFHDLIVTSRRDVLAETHQLLTVDTDAIAGLDFSDPVFRMCF